MKLIDQLKQRRADKVPPGWMRLEVLARKEGMADTSGRGSFYNTVREAVAAGLLEKNVFLVATASGVRPVAHYRYVKAA